MTHHGVTDFNLSHGPPLGSWVRTPLQAPHWVAGLGSLPLWKLRPSSCDLECEDVSSSISAAPFPAGFLRSGFNTPACFPSGRKDHLLGPGDALERALRVRRVFLKDWFGLWISAFFQTFPDSNTKPTKQPWVRGLSYLIQPTGLILLVMKRIPRWTELFALLHSRTQRQILFTDLRFYLSYFPTTYTLLCLPVSTVCCLLVCCLRDAYMEPHMYIILISGVPTYIL